MKKEKQRKKTPFFLPSFLKRATSPLAIPLIKKTQFPSLSLFFFFSQNFLFAKKTRKKKKEKEKEKLGASRRNSESSLKSQPFYRRYKPILPTSLNYIVLNRPEAIHLGDLMRFLVRIDPNRSVTMKKKDENSENAQRTIRVWNESPIYQDPKQTKRIITIQKRMVSEVVEIKW